VAKSAEAAEKEASVADLAREICNPTRNDYRIERLIWIWAIRVGGRELSASKDGSAGIAGRSPPNIFENEVLRSIAGKYQKTVAQIILRWLTQRSVVVIPKSVRMERIEENFNVFDIDLSPEDMAAIATLDTKTSSFFDHRDPVMVERLGERKLNI
jgi:hypothetical protein